MDSEAISLISQLLAQHCVATQLAADQAKQVWAKAPESEATGRACVDAMMAAITALRVQNAFYAFIGQEG